MADKYLKNNGESLKEVSFLQVSAGAGDAGKGVGLNPQGKIDDSMMPVGIGADTKAIIASEALSAGNWVNIWDNTGAFNVRKADATIEGKFCDGFVLAACASSELAIVYFEGTNNQLSGLTPGQMFLGTTAGQGTILPPAASGNVVQCLGTVVSATEVKFERGTPVVLA